MKGIQNGVAVAVKEAHNHIQNYKSEMAKKKNEEDHPVDPYARTEKDKEDLSAFFNQMTN